MSANQKTTADTPKTPLTAKKMSAPNPLLIIIAIILVGALASYIVPAGSFTRMEDPVTHKLVVDPNSFEYVEQVPIGFFDLFMTVSQGIQKSSGIIAFLFIIGGAFGMMEETGAIRSGMGTLVRKMRGRELLLVPATMLIFTLGAAFAANNEEFLAFLPLVLSICLAMGFDSLTALGIVFGSVAAGYGAGCTNAFTVGVAQGISGLPLFSGIELRLAVLVVLYLINATFVTAYALRIKRNPQRSSMYELDRLRPKTEAVSGEETLTRRHVLVLLAFLAAVVFLVYGVIEFGFYIDELAALFLIMGVAAGILGGLNPKRMADSFMKGCNNMLLPCIMVGMCKAITLVLTQACIMDTIIHFLAGLLSAVPPIFTAFGMFIVQDLFNILVPSGSGQAAITMPIMAPLADLVGVTRQTAVLAFQFGDAFTNCITPASGMTVSCLAIAGVPLKKWWKFILPLFALWVLTAFVFLTYATVTSYGPF